MLATNTTLPVLQPIASQSAAAAGAEAMAVQWLPKLRAFLSRRISNTSDIDDLAQDILLRILQGAGNLSDEARMHAWVWQVARNAVIDHYRRKPRQREVELENLNIPAYDRQPDIDEIVTSWLAPMVEELPNTYREAVRLSELEGLPHAEIARRLSITVSGVKSRIQRGRAKLREAMFTCCQFEFDVDGRITGFRRNAPDCVAGVC